MKMTTAFRAEDVLVQERSKAAQRRRRNEGKKEENIPLGGKLIPATLGADSNTVDDPDGISSLIRARVEKLQIPAGYNNSLYEACKRAYESCAPVKFNAGRTVGRQDVFGVVKAHYQCGNMARVLNCEIEVSADGNDYVIHPPARIIVSKAA